jgi:penicillin amidase
MAKRRRILLGTGSFIVLAVLAVMFLSYRLLTKSFPQTSGTLQLTILENPVDVYRDDYGVPHIYAQNRSDLFKAVGFVTAQDRLWQMDLHRRTASGKLSEILGKDAIEYDRFLRMWGFERLADTFYPQLSPESRRVLDDYTAGVNAYITTNTDKLPVEFSLLRYKPAPWRPQDSVAFARLMAWKLSFSWHVDLVLHQIIEKVGRNKAQELFPDFPQQGPYIVADSDFILQPGSSFLAAGMRLCQLLGVRIGHMGSNSWVVAGEKSWSGKPLLANDPHLDLTAPSIWYEMHLAADDLDVMGVSLPGVPGIVIGHNRSIAWGLTNGMIDDVDFYIERVNPDDSTQYWHDGQWRHFEQVEEEIPIKGEDALQLRLLKTENGVVVTDFHPVLKGDETPVSMRWTGFEFSDELLSYLKLMQAGTWDSFKDALRHFKVPAQNFVFAAADGDIGYYLAGAIPIRKRTTGVLPHRGWLSQGEWTDVIPFEELPHAFNPPENYLVTANNRIVDERYPYYLSNLWEPQSRSARIHRLLREKARFSLQDFQAMQLDIESEHAKRLVPVVVSAAVTELENAVPNELDNGGRKKYNDVAGTVLDNAAVARLRIFHDLLSDWDCVESRKSIATSIFHAFLVKVTENILQDKLGDKLYKNYISLGNVPTRVIAALLQREESDWFDKKTTAAVESRNDIIVESLLQAGDLLEETAGADIANWVWGDIHTITMKHLLGVKKPLDILLNIGPLPLDGSTMTVNKGEYALNAPFHAQVGPSMRQLIDLDDPLCSFSVITSGQSGQVMSQHYRDQTQLWLAGELRQVVMDKEKIIHSASAHLELVP